MNISEIANRLEELRATDACYAMAEAKHAWTQAKKAAKAAKEKYIAAQNAFNAAEKACFGAFDAQDERDT